MDKFELTLVSLATIVTIFMIASLFYLYVAAGSSWNLVVQALFDYRVLSALLISVSSAFIVGALAIGAAIPVAYVLTYKKFRGKGLIETLLIEFPQTFPPATVGLVYLIMFGQGSPIDIAYTYPAIIVAKFYIAAPFAMSFTLRRFREINKQGLDMIAKSLGSNTQHLVQWVLIPLSTRDLLAGFSLTWARAMGEVAATFIFAGAIPGKTEIFPAIVLIYANTEPQLALAASVIAAALSIGALLSFKWIAREKK